MSRTDLNKAAEIILIPLLNEVYGWNLENINYTEDDNNYPGIDLVDKAARISIQVTATPSLEKVKHTLKQFIKHNQYLKYDRLIVYILKRKQDSYSETAIQGIIQNTFNFESQKNIWDYCDILKEVSNLQIDKTLRVKEILEAYFGEDQRFSSVLAARSRQKIDWRETCRNLLSHWKGLTTNALMRRSGVRFQLDEIFVPLGVVERRKKPKHRSDDGASAEQGSELYEEKITPISQNDFFEQVLRQRQSKHSQGKRIAIIGEPGAGKTTQLQKIGDWILEETDGIPIWIPLAEVGTRKLREYLLGDWLQTAIQELEVSLEHRDELGQLLKTGKIWLLLDGVDEMAISDTLYQIATQMREGWLQNVRVVLTCRLNVWDVGKNALDGFDVYRNLDFEYPTEVHQLVDKWFTTEPALQQKLKVALEQPGKERIRDMVKNPLRLTLLCYSWQLRQGELPETKAGLYEWFVDTFYEWNKGKVPIQLSAAKRSELNRTLGELAKEAIDQKSSRFRLREKFVNRFLGAADDEDSLFYLALQLGWLNRIGVAAENPLENVYAFFHPMFQEYFAALAIDNHHFFLNHIAHNPGEGIYRIFEAQWREVFLLWLNQQHLQSGDNKKLIEYLFEFDDGIEDLHFFRYQALFLAAQGVFELQNTPLEIRYEITERVIEQVFAYENSMSEFNYLMFIDPVEKEAWETLERIDQTRVIHYLLNKIEKNQSIFVKLRCAYFVLKVDPFNQKIINFLVELYSSKKYEFLQFNICEVLERIKLRDSGVIEVLQDILEDKTLCIITREVAAESLLRFEPDNSKAINYFINILQGKEADANFRYPDHDWDFPDFFFEIVLKDTSLANLFIHFMHHGEDDWIRWKSANCLSKIPEYRSEAFAVLIEVLENSQDGWLIKDVAERVLELDPYNLTVIRVLFKLLGSSSKELINGQHKEFEESEQHELYLTALIPDILNFLLEHTKYLLNGNLENLVEMEKSDTYLALLGEIENAVDIINDSNLQGCLLKIKESNSDEINAKYSDFRFILKSFLATQSKQYCNDLLNLLKDDELHWHIEYYFAEIVFQEPIVSLMVRSLRDVSYQNSTSAFRLLWYSARGMGYPDFYRAWHSSCLVNTELSTNDEEVKP